MRAWEALDGAQVQRWSEVLDAIAALLPGPHSRVVVDGPPPLAATVADRLVDTLHAVGQPCVRLTDTSPEADEDGWWVNGGARSTTVADGARWRSRPPHAPWHVVIWLRSHPVAPGEDGTDVVIDLHDPGWPVIRHVAPGLDPRQPWYVTESRAFFGIRAATWDSRFGDDTEAYGAAIAEAGLRPGHRVLDVGCGTGRALPALRAAVGAGGVVAGVDLTPQMLAVAADRARASCSALVLGDARRLPFAADSTDAIFAAGLVMHLPDLEAGLAELARVTRAGGRLIVFHPYGRAALAARHGRALTPDDPLDQRRFGPALVATGWRLDRYDDPPHRFLALATRAVGQVVAAAA
ncbi:Methyltransferase domain-containing protein [Asanoa hainanensis]|uniref:Methyltransferase domain-containing protein n=1 Tax=Asanoa hainanensis TaxID=560556 RepID=A0A239P9Q1_9ACTN|nr:Methyltransferase domain-containing protein [Asanoa hainanensis]